MKKFFFGDKPKPKSVPGSAQASSSSSDSQHRSSLAKLYSKLLGDTEVRDHKNPKSSQEDFVHWEESSSPVKQGKSSPERIGGGNVAGQGTSALASVVDADLSDVDPVQELMDKYSAHEAYPPLTAPNIPYVHIYKTRGEDYDDIDSTCAGKRDAVASIHGANKARRSESALATIVPPKSDVSIGNKPASVSDSLHSNLYSPGYLKRSISFTKGYPFKVKRHEKSHPSPHFSELISLASDTVEQASRAVGSPESKRDVKHSSKDVGGRERPTNMHTDVPLREPLQEPPTDPMENTDSDDTDDIDMLELDRLLSQAPVPEDSSKQVSKNLPKDLSTDASKALPAPAAAPVPISSTNINISTSDLESSDSDSDMDLQELDDQIKSTQAAGLLKAEKPPPLPENVVASSQIDIKTIKMGLRERVLNKQTVETTIKQANVLRYLVESIATDETSAQILLNVSSTTTSTVTRVILRGTWFYDAFVEVGDIIQIVLKQKDDSKYTKDSSAENNELVVDDQSNLLIVNPDILLTCTAVSQSFSCQRRVVLHSRVKSSESDPPKVMVYGSIVHELFQDALTTRNFSNEYLFKRIDDLVKNAYSEDLFLAGVAQHQAIHELTTEYLPNFPEWKAKYFDSKPSEGVNLIEYPTKGDDNSRLFIKEVLDIEQEIWSPVYGLKGNIDATVLASVQDLNGTHDTIVPFELKTSKSSKTVAHRAQTILYTLLLSERYSLEETPFGLLCYICIDEMFRVSVSWRELTALIVGRNSLAQYYRPTVKEDDINALQGIQVLPEPIKNEFICNRCDWSEECPVYHYADQGNAAINPDNNNSGGYSEIFSTNVEHLTTNHMDFFNKWHKLLAMEEATVMVQRKLIWTSSSKNRQALGDCFGGMKVLELEKEVLLTENSGAGKNKTYQYSLVPFEVQGGSMGSMSDIMTNLTTGDKVVVSDENGHVCLASGTFLQVDKSRVTIQINRELKSDVLYRIDKDEIYHGMTLARRNIVDLFRRSGDHRKRDFIVDLQPPRFLSTAPSFDLDKSKFNPDQVKVITKVLRTVDYSLVLGMPGTGKTTTIAAIIDILINQLGKTVLIASQTHSAVDNIVLKLKNRGFDILRVGAYSRVHPDAREFLLDGPITSGDDLAKKVLSPPLVATTCYAVTNWIFSKRPMFDFCIVDEASQTTLPSCLGPLKLADKFILVGDHYQLSPLVKSPQALEAGLDVSLFKLLCTEHPSAVVNLSYQYRMCSDIMMLSNKLVYDGMLACGNEEVANRCLKVDLSRLESGGSQQQQTITLPKWLSHVLAESTRVTFLDTDDLPGSESTSGDGIQNNTEARMTKMIVNSLCSAGVSESDIGVISVYKAQVRLLKAELAARRSRGLEILTADKSQGRDKDCVIISLVRSNEKDKIGDLLQDWRRLNVSFTRAKSKLVIIGSRKTLSLAAAMKEFLRILHEQSWIHTVEKGGLDFDEPGSRELSQGQGFKLSQRPTTYKNLLKDTPVLRDIVNELS